MFAAILVLSLAGVKNENPKTNPGKVECLNATRPSPKQESTNNPGTDKCTIIAVPAKPEKVRR